ncbi:MAG: hypothetical protein AW07_04512 [Candidatus Accumulibacter sp. SK-11]|nr:MAG: hypothetical protein AW07_04512 [Candidatus Accumulibacter sp. SK-11]
MAVESSPEELKHQLKRAVQQGWMQVGGDEFGCDERRNVKGGERRVAVFPPVLDALERRAVGNAKRACQLGVAAGIEVRRALRQLRQHFPQQTVLCLANDTGRSVYRPVGAAELLTAANRQAAVARVDRQSNDCRAVVGKQQGRTDLQILDFDDGRGLPGKCRRQRQFGIGRTGENRRIADDVIREHRVELGVEMVLPGQFVLRQRIAEQRMDLVAVDQAE